MFWTILLVSVVMASNKGAWGGASGTEDEEGTVEMSQDEIFRSQVSTSNRFSGFQARVGNQQPDSDWQVKMKKRKRHETGSVDIEEFSKMNMDERMLVLFSKLSIVEGKTNYLHAVMPPAQERIDVVENCVNIHARKLKMLAYRSIDLEARSRRNNLIFRGLADMPSENSAELIVDFLEVELDLIINTDQIARAHRLGSLMKAKRRYAVTRRPVIVAFKDYTLTETIMNASSRLKGSGFRVERDYPREIAEARQRLWPILKAERAKHPNGRVTIAYPAKLVKNRRVIHDEFPDWYKVLRVSRATGFESDSDSGLTGDETDTESRVRGGEQPFRPWQGESGSRAHGSSYDSTRDVRDQVGSQSQSSSGQQHTQGARPKVFTNKKHSSGRSNQKKLTEIMAEKLRDSRSRPPRNRINFAASSKPSQNSENPSKRLNDRPNSSNSSSLFTKQTRGNDTSGSVQMSNGTNEPMNVDQARDTGSSSTNPPMADETTRDTTTQTQSMKTSHVM